MCNAWALGDGCLSPRMTDYALIFLLFLCRHCRKPKLMSVAELGNKVSFPSTFSLTIHRLLSMFLEF